ncbi:hypothetical protein BAVI_10206 [Neobacillus vireti LMG 21834]|uniref:Secreted protein n=1 Tax=Neobacillus vireti LMG 21834 TaxID=1131730 RepID=A0AB94IQ35_9BACI|nr:hypothetical protein BAVI_10206 [Neobacillus vireti LMG 21834]
MMLRQDLYLLVIALHLRKITTGLLLMLIIIQKQYITTTLMNTAETHWMIKAWQSILTFTMERTIITLFGMASK